MPGIIAPPKPTAVFPQTLCLAFAESRNYEQIRNEYHDGTPQASQLAQTSRKTFQLSRRLTASQLATLRTFYENVDGQLGAFFFYNPFDAAAGQPIGSNFDPSGVNTTGRYIVAFRNNWTEISSMVRSDVTGIQLVELGDADGTYLDLSGFGQHGAILSATLSTLTSHVQGSPNPALCFAQDPVANPLTVLATRFWMGGSTDNSIWTLRTDTLALATTGLNDFQFAFGSGPPNGIDTTADQLLIYDCTVTVTFTDGANIVYHPKSAVANFSLQDGAAPGTLTNPGFAIDGNTSTAAVISATAWGTIYFSPILILSGLA